jgi:hypothetical protein
MVREGGRGTMPRTRIRRPIEENRGEHCLETQTGPRRKCLPGLTGSSDDTGRAGGAQLPKERGLPCGLLSVDEALRDDRLTLLEHTNGPREADTVRTLGG